MKNLDKQKDRENAIAFYSKLSNKEKELFRECASIILPEKKALTFDDLIQFEKAKESLLPLKDKYKISIDELFDFVREQLFIPVNIFNKKLTVLESIVKHLKEEKNLSLHKISEILGRDERNIWHTYNNSKKKYSSKIITKKIELWIPVSIFDGKLSALESVAYYLHDKLGLKFSQIADLLNRDQRTIWTSYSRAKKKYVRQK